VSLFSFLPLLDQAVERGKILPETRDNVCLLLGEGIDPVAVESVRELAVEGRWDELNNRFFRTLSFGTGGLRGKTISTIVTMAERGDAHGKCPQHPAVGTNTMNFYNIRRATRGLATYLKQCFPERVLKVVIAHDTRYFSAAFAGEAARVLASLGIQALVFRGCRSTPELSFAIRRLGAAAGINVTASHNPPAYNGYKVYFDDGAQIVEPHASGIIAEVGRSSGDPVLGNGPGPIVHDLGKEMDEAYLERLMSVPVRPELLSKASKLRVVYTPLHGTGSVIMKPLLDRLGVIYSTVASQDLPDGSFSTVEAPNPEVPSALKIAVKQAGEENADLVIATDPDADRMGVAVRAPDGNYKLLTGNQTGSLMAWYRGMMFLETGILPEEDKGRGVIIKTFVTTPHQEAIARHLGIPFVNTLTGFKHIANKLKGYEEQIPQEIRGGYADLSEMETRALRLRHSRLLVFASEESYGYIGCDFVRDKDAHAAAVMFLETAAYALSCGLTVLELLDQIFCQTGYFEEQSESLVMEGADGAVKIRRLIETFQQDPPSSIGERSVSGITDFSRGDVMDEEGEWIPEEDLMIFDLGGGSRFAVRPSGTEPKIKFYLFASRQPGPKPFSLQDLREAKMLVAGELAGLWRDVKKEIDRRLDSIGI